MKTEPVTFTREQLLGYTESVYRDGHRDGLRNIVHEKADDFNHLRRNDWLRSDSIKNAEEIETQIQ